jgi:hypothetical protein
MNLVLPTISISTTLVILTLPTFHRIRRFLFSGLLGAER